MNVENLSVNQRIKNYKELCNILNIDVKSGNTKKAQFKELERFVKYEKDGNSFIIKEIYDIPLMRKDNRIYNKGTSTRGKESKVITSGIQYQILNIMIKNLDHKVNLYDDSLSNMQSYYFNISTLYYAVGLVNNQYYYGKSNYTKVSSAHNIPYEHVKDFFSLTNDKLDYYVKKALDELHNKRIITFFKTKALHFQAIQISKDAIEKNDSFSAEITNTTEYANKNQLAYIDYCERKVLDLWNMNSMNDIRYKSAQDRNNFYNECTLYIRQHARQGAKDFNDDKIKTLETLERYHPCYEIRFIPAWIRKEFNKIEKNIINNDELTRNLFLKENIENGNILPENENEIINFINHHTLLSIFKNIDERTKENNIFSDFDKNGFRSDLKYNSNQKELSNHYINRNNDNKKTLYKAYKKDNVNVIIK